MIIAWVTSFFPPDRVAGAELGTEMMARGMAKRGHEAHVLITRPDETGRGTEVRDGFQIHWLPSTGIRGLRFPVELGAAAAKLRELKPDIVHANCLLPGGAIATRYARSYGAKSVILCYGYDVCDIKPWQLRLFGKPAMKRTDALLCATRFCETVVRGHGINRDDIQVFSAGFDGEAIPRFPLRETGAVKKILFVGRMIPEKNLPLLLKVMSILRDRGYELHIVGDGERLEEYKMHAGELSVLKNTRFYGRVSNARVGELLSESDVFVLPSRREPFGVVALEAAMAGVPVVASSVMGLPEALGNGDYGMLIGGEDPKEWADAIARACEDRELRSRFYANSARARNFFEWTSRIDQLESLYLKLTQNTNTQATE